MISLFLMMQKTSLILQTLMTQLLEHKYDKNVVILVLLV